MVENRDSTPVWGSKKAALIASIYSIEPDELETATRIFGE